MGVVAGPAHRPGSRDTATAAGAGCGKWRIFFEDGEEIDMALPANDAILMPLQWSEQVRAGQHGRLARFQDRPLAVSSAGRDLVSRLGVAAFGGLTPEEAVSASGLRQGGERGGRPNSVRVSSNAAH